MHLGMCKLHMLEIITGTIVLLKLAEDWRKNIFVIIETQRRSLVALNSGLVVF